MNIPEHEDKKEDKTPTSTTDRVSELPDSIILHILSFLPMQDAARTIAISKRWSCLSSSYPILNFDEGQFICKPTSYYSESCRRELSIKFVKWVCDSLDPRCNKIISIEKFRLRSVLGDHSWVPLYIDDWMSFVIKRNVKYLNLEITKRLPQSIFESKSITVLKLSGCRLDPHGAIQIPSLQKLYLCGVDAENAVFHNLIHSSPMIEDLQIVKCRSLRSLRVSSSTLKSVELIGNTRLDSIEIDSMNLQSYLSNYGGLINISPCSTLKTISIEKHPVFDNFLEDVISKLPFLESLILVKCETEKSINISNQGLKKLVLKDCKNIKEARIDTPSLLSFSYGGFIISFPSMNTFNLLKANISLLFYPSKFDTSWYINLRQFLQSFNHPKFLSLKFFGDKDLIFPKEQRNTLLPPLYDVTHLKVGVWTWISPTEEEELVGGLRWICPGLQILCIDRGCSKKRILFQSGEAEEREKDPSIR